MYARTYAVHGANWHYDPVVPSYVCIYVGIYIIHNVYYTHRTQFVLLLFILTHFFLPVHALTRGRLDINCTQTRNLFAVFRLDRGDPVRSKNRVIIHLYYYVLVLCARIHCTPAIRM